MTKDLFKKIFASFLFVALALAQQTHALAQEAKQPSGVSASGNGSTPSAQSPDAEKGEEDENAAYLKSPSVRALGAKLGMNPDQAATAFQVANFIVLAALLGWFLAKALPKTFRSRNTAIQKHLVDARTATEEANARLGSVEARLGKLDGQIAELRAQADKDSSLDEQRIKASVEEEKQKILAAAEQEIAAATLHAHRQLQQYAAELAIEQAGHKLIINAETDRLLIQSFTQRLSNDKGGQN
ncbi:F0F1 ATP synthase subunit B family protein [Granulicella arctica]|uniref:F0F1 ATP synthase subunit B family protein n=1 Tax=Granulicella arctica TaxID=940613 RepID=UPI0021DFAF8D|nr:ATPase [Granulicella arctica]